MLNVWTIFRRELKNYLFSPALYVFLAIFLAASGACVFYLQNVFTGGVASMALYFDVIPALLLIFVPAVAMRLWSEENRAGTLELLMTLPVNDWEAVVGKYLAAALVLVAAVGMTLPIPMFIGSLAWAKAPMDWGPVWGGYAGALLTGLAYLSIAGAVSASTKSQIIAFIIGVAMCFLAEGIGKPAMLIYMPKGIAPIVEFAGISTHARNFFRGVFDTRDLFYFASLTALMLFATVRIVESRRWR